MDRRPSPSTARPGTDAWHNRAVLTEELVPVAQDVELHVATSNPTAARTLLVVHGGPDWDHSYLRQPLDRLADTVRLVMPDLRGCGRSTVGLPDEAYTPDAVVNALLALLDALDAEHVDVLGFSYGGLIAQRLVVSEATVKTHINRIFARTGVRDRAQAVAYAYRTGVASP